MTQPSATITFNEAERLIPESIKCRLRELATMAESEPVKAATELAMLGHGAMYFQDMPSLDLIERYWRHLTAGKPARRTRIFRIPRLITVLLQRLRRQ